MFLRGSHCYIFFSFMCFLCVEDLLFVVVLEDLLLFCVV